MLAQVLWMFLLATGVSAAEVTETSVPTLTNPVMDEAGLLNPDTVQTLDQGLRQLQAAKGTQIAVLTVAELHGEPIESYSTKVADAWKLGDKKREEGLILILAAKEKKIRIEVGRGLEGTVPDITAKRIIDQEITPRLHEGDVDSGVLVGVASLIKTIHPDLDINALFNRPEPTQRAPRGGHSLFPLLLFGLIFLFFLRRGGGGGGGFLAGALLGNLLGGGRRGGWGGGGGGGGFSGGGGGFSGGGASGSW